MLKVINFNLYILFSLSYYIYIILIKSYLGCNDMDGRGAGREGGGWGDEVEG